MNAIDVSELEKLFARNKAVFDWCIRSASKAHENNQIEAAAEWCHLGAFSAAFNGWFGQLASPELETILRQLSGHVPNRVPRKKITKGRNWLHVMTTAFDIGGHTNTLCRWIRMDSGSACHHLAVTDQYRPFPDKLRKVVTESGGEVKLLDGNTLVQKAQALWEMAAALADVVVLHIHPQEVSAILAFGAQEEIPVCFMNHNDHLFWVGSSVADRIIEFRNIGRRWTKNFRGANRPFLLPLPFEDATYNRAFDKHRHWEARSRLRISKKQVVLLTVATAYKYEPVGEWDFLIAVEKILNSCPEAVFIAVGPENKGRWAEDVGKYGDRFRLVGASSDISDGNSDYHLAADVGLGSFPFASQNAMLEFAWLGISCVPTPSAIPFGLDDISLEGIPWPITQQDYVEMVVRLVRSEVTRDQQGLYLARSVAQHHCGSGWMDRLNRMCITMPSRHQAYEPGVCASLDLEICRFWAAFTRLNQLDALEHIHGRIISKEFEVIPQHDQLLMAVLRGDAKRVAFPGFTFMKRKLRFQAGKLRRLIVP